jgi:hypothetical protein
VCGQGPCVYAPAGLIKKKNLKNQQNPSPKPETLRPPVATLQQVIKKNKIKYFFLKKIPWMAQSQ